MLTLRNFFLPHYNTLADSGQRPEARGRGGESNPGAAHGEKFAITLCPVRESNLGPLCASSTTLTTQLTRRTKVWSGNPTDVIPMEYRVPLQNTSIILDLLKSVSPQWLLSTLFSFIRAKLGCQPTGGQVDQPEWPLTVVPAPTVAEGRRNCVR